MHAPKQNLKEKKDKIYKPIPNCLNSKQNSQQKKREKLTVDDDDDDADGDDDDDDGDHV